MVLQKAYRAELNRHITVVSSLTLAATLKALDDTAWPYLAETPVQAGPV